MADFSKEHADTMLGELHSNGGGTLDELVCACCGGSGESSKLATIISDGPHTETTWATEYSCSLCRGTWRIRWERERRGERSRAVSAYPAPTPAAAG